MWEYTHDGILRRYNELMCERERERERDKTDLEDGVGGV